MRTEFFVRLRTVRKQSSTHSVFRRPPLDNRGVMISCFSWVFSGNYSTKCSRGRS
jgi:hypothetical protein